jgi:hypothetical protein
MGLSNGKTRDNVTSTPRADKDEVAIYTGILCCFTDCAYGWLVIWELLMTRV